MRRTLQFGSFFVLLTAAVQGCGPSYDESLLSPDVTVRVIHPDAPAGGRGKDDGARGISSQVIYWEGPNAGEVEVVVDNGRLLVDGQAYGTVSPNDLVVIDALNGKSVTVNGTARRPGGSRHHTTP